MADSGSLLPQLLRCIEQDDSLALRTLRQSETSTLLCFALNEKRRDGITALHLAALKGRHECMEELLEMKADVDIRARRAAFRETPLHMAASNGFTRCVELLLRHGADINARSITEATPQSLAVYHRQPECAEILDKARERQLEKERQNKMQETAFFAACCSGDVPVLEELLEESTSFMECKDADGYTPMQRACASSKHGVVEFLIRKGTCVKCLHESSGDNLLHVIARTRQYAAGAAIARRLLEADPSLAAMQNKDLALPLHIACEQGNLALTTVLLRFQEQVMELIKSCYCPQLGSDCGEDGFSFEYLKHTVDFWLKKDNADVDEITQVHDINGTLNWQTQFCPMRFPKQDSGEAVDAACSGHGLMFPVNSCRNSDGNTPVHLAVIKGNHYIVRQLLLYGGFESDDGNQPLSPRAMSPTSTAPRLLANNRLFDGQYACVSLIVENARGYQPLHEAIVHGHAKLMYILGAEEEENLFRSNSTKFRVEHHELNRQMTLLDLAVATKHLDVLGLLLVHYDAAEFMSDGLQLAGDLEFTQGASLLLAKMVHDSCAKFFREQISRDGLSNSNVENLNVGQIIWEKIGLKALDTNYLQLASWVVSRFIKTAQGFLAGVQEMTTLPNQNALDTMLETVFERSSSCALTSFRMALISPPALTSNLITVLNLSQNQLTQVPLTIFQLPQLKILILSDNKLTWLPVPSGDSIHYSQDEDMQDLAPASVINFALTPAEDQYNCPQLAQIEVQNNMLTDIPGALFTLEGLEVLDVSNNELTSLPFEIWTAEKLRTLRANGNGITSLPTDPESHMQPIEESNGSQSHGLSASRQMSRQGFARISSFLAKHSSRTTTTGVYRQRRSRNGIPVSLPEDAEINYPLKKLFLVQNRLKSLPNNLHCLAPNLEELDVSNNQLEMLNILSLPSNILVFRANHNRLNLITSDHITGPCAWPLLEMNGSGSATNTGVDQVNSRPVNCKHFIGFLPRLSTLRLSENQLDNLHVMVTYDPNTGRGLSEGGDDDEDADTTDGGGGGNSMMSPATTGNSNSSGYKSAASALSGIPAGHALLMPSLTFLYIDRNEFTQVPEGLHHCRSLNVLFIGQNKIEELPSDLGNLTHLYQLDVSELDLKNMHAAVLDRGNKAIISYLRAIKTNSVEHRRLKLMIVGRHGQGKTTLVKALQHGPGRSKQKQLSTVGVSVQCWCSVTRSTKPFQKAPDPINFCVWDFGGQEEYYATHQCFLSRRALYIAVWNMETGLSGICELQPWLVNIQARAPGSTVIIVGTHLDKVQQSMTHAQVQELKDEVRRRYVVDRSGLPRPGLPNVVEAMELSNLKTSSVRELRDLVYNVASEIRAQSPGPGAARRESVRMIDQMIPESYSVLEKAVREASTAFARDGKVPVLTTADYISTMIQYSSTPDKLPRDDEINDATSFLHDYGVLLHYEEPALQDLYFINPQWLCQTLSRVIAVKEVNSFAKKGVMNVSDLQFLLKFEATQFPTKIFDQCVNLMERFEIALRISRTILLIPSMLPQRYEEGQRTVDFGGHRMPGNRETDDGVSQSFNASFSQSYSGQRQVIASTFHKLTRATRLRLETFRQEQLSQASPSELLSPRVDMPKSIAECDFNPGEDFCRLYVTPYIPSGFWPRLISRILSDKMMNEVIVQELPTFLKAPGLRANDLLDWICWRSGIELHLAWCPVLRVCRLNDTMTCAAKCEGRVFCSGNWHPLGPIGHSGVEVFINVHAIREVLEILHADAEPVLPRCSTTLTQSARVSVGRRFLDNVHQQFLGLKAESQKVKKGRLTHSRSVAKESKQLSSLRERRSRLAMMVAESLDYVSSQSEPSAPMDSTSRPPSTTEEIDPMESLRDLPQLAEKAVEATKDTAETKERSETPRQRGTQLAVWLLARVVSHIDALLYKWFNGLHSNEGYSANKTRPTIIRVSPCPRCMVEMRKRMSCETVDVDAEAMPEAVYDMANSLARRIFKAATNPSPNHSSLRRGNPVRLHSAHDEDDGDAPDETALRVFSLYSLAAKADADIDVSKCEMECERHGSLSTLRLAPDLFFADLPADKIVTTADYVQCTSLDRGGFGEVFNGRLFKTKTGHPHPVAIKNFELSKDDDADDDMADGGGEMNRARRALHLYTTARAEIGILANLNHDNIVKLLGVNRKPLRMIMARAPAGNLKNWLGKYRSQSIKLPSDVLLACLTQMASALEYLHDKQIIYRDLKPGNTLVWSFPAPTPIGSPEDKTPVLIRLADYGISQFCSPSGIKGLKDGTRVYMAPEVVQYGGKETFNEKIDVYAYGANMYELLALSPPYANECMLSITEQIKRGYLVLPRKHRRRFLQVHQLMRWCIRLDPQQRPSFKQVSTVLNSPGFLRLVDKVRITDTSTVTAGAGRMPCPVSIGVGGRMDSIADTSSAQGASVSATFMRASLVRNASDDCLLSMSNDVSQQGCMSTVWLGDGSGTVTMVDYRRGKNPRPSSVKVCNSHVTGLLSIDNHVWVASEHDGLFVYDCALSQCHQKWTGAGLGVAIGNYVEERRMSASLAPKDEATAEDAGHSERVGSIDLNIASEATGQRNMRFRTVSILAIQSCNLVLVVYGEGSLAVFGSNVADNGAGEFVPRRHHKCGKGREVSSMALIRPQPGVEEVWLGLQSGDILVVSTSQLLSEELLLNIDPSRVIDVLGECPEYKLKRRIRLLTSISTSRASANSNFPSPGSSESSDSADAFEIVTDSEVWVAMDRMSIASCWSTSTRQLVKPSGILDCQQENIIARLPGCSHLQHERETRVTAILPLSDKVILGTGGGHIVVASLDPLVPLTVFAAYTGSVMCLLPFSFPVSKRKRARSIRRGSAGFRITSSSAPANDLEGCELVLSCGQAYRGLYTGPGPAEENAASVCTGAAEQITEGHLLMWLVDDLQPSENAGT
eukprot:scpid2720/ scgid5797/ Leucine-rich repeat serine/threonine-protein kinase 1